MSHGQNMENKKRKLSQKNVNFAKIGGIYKFFRNRGKIYKFCGNRGNMQYA